MQVKHFAGIVHKFNAEMLLGRIYCAMSYL